MYAYDSEHDTFSEIPQSYSNFENFVEDKSSERIIIRRHSTLSTISRSFSREFLVSRIISRGGRINIFIKKIHNKNRQYFRDFGNTLLTIRWRWILVTLCATNFVCFLLFGLLWMAVAGISGDFADNPEEFCVVNTRSFTGYFLLGVETIMTIGYGYRYPTEKCAQGWILQAFQALVNVAIQGVLVSAVYVKISKPSKDSISLFSKKAVICLRDGKLCFVVRIIDLVGQISVGTNITMYFVNKDVSASVSDYETNPLYIEQINVKPHGFLVFPQEIVHVIDSRSPFWNITACQLLRKRMEVIVVAEGCSLVTGQPSQKRTSYINSDVLWGHRFKSCVEFNYDKMKYIINCKEVNKTIPFDTPLCSAQELNDIEESLVQETRDMQFLI